MTESKLLSLDDAVARFVEPRSHLHFAANPSRSNASVRAVCRRFRDQAPSFVVSSTGFHASLHLFARLGLASRLIGCFFGDNYPRPRPNELYERALASGVSLEHWSLLTFVTALRAGALGQAWGVTRSLAGSTLGEDLARLGRFVVAKTPGAEDVGLVAAMRPDVVFLHAPASDAEGRVLVAPPFGEGMWAALGAKRGVVVTVERVVPSAVTRSEPGSIALPPERVLAVCPSPFGAHPQPLFSSPRFDVDGYDDDLDAYAQMRELGATNDAGARLAETLLASEEVYATHFALYRRAPRMERRARFSSGRSEESDRLILLAARRIASATRERGHRVLLAGIGHAFFATRLAKLLLDEAGVQVPAVVETGLFDFDCASDAGDFLLGARVVGASKRLTSIEDTLGAIVCGADNRCLGVLGAAEVDARGDVNTTRLPTGRLLVGSGGANDIASAAAEVVVLVSSLDQLVPRVHYVTSPGARVRSVVTPLGVLVRDDEDAPWRVEEAWGDVRELAARCPFGLEIKANSLAPRVSPREAELLAQVLSTEPWRAHA